MAFIPTTVKIQAYLFNCFTSISQYIKASISNTQPPDASASGADVASGAADEHDTAAALASSDQQTEQAGDVDLDADEVELEGSTCQQPQCPAITTLAVCTSR